MRQKGFTSILIIIIIMLIIIVGAYYIKTRKGNFSPSPTQSPLSVINTSTVPTATQFPTIAADSKIGYIKSIIPNYDLYLLEIDYVNYIQDSSAPNGFLIENPSPELTTLPIDQNLEVVMQTFSRSPDGNFNFNQPISFSQFLDTFNSNLIAKNIPYWIETQNGTVTKIIEQYIP